MNLNTSSYRIYLLTLWAERGEQAETPAVWRFSLQDPQTGERHAFASLTALVAALLEEIARNEGMQLEGGELLQEQ